MNYPAMPEPPAGYRLAEAVFATYDLDLPMLVQLLGGEDPSKYTIIRGDGEFLDLPEDDPRRTAWHERIITAAFPEEGGRPSAYVHGKFRLLAYEAEDPGSQRYHLTVHSANLSAYDNLEAGVHFTGEASSVPQPKTEPLRAYLAGICRLSGSGTEHLRILAEQLQTVRFSPVHAGAGEMLPGEDAPEGWSSDGSARDWELLAPGCGADGDFLLEPYDELLVIAPFLSRTMLRRILASRRNDESRFVLLTHPSSMADYLSHFSCEDPATLPEELERIIYITAGEDPDTSRSGGKVFAHAKCYLRRCGSRWDLWCGSMNPTDQSMHRNMEMMVHLTDPSGVTSIEGFLAPILGKTEDQIRLQLDPDPASCSKLRGGDLSFQPGDSPVFLEAARRRTRMACLLHMLHAKSCSPHDTLRLISYYLSGTCVRDLMLMIRGDKMPAVPERLVIRDRGKDRELYLFPVEDRALLGLINFALHRFDGRFSEHLYSHIRGRANAYALSVIREREDFRDLHLFKTDISRYDYTMDAGILSGCIREFFPEDPSLCAFFDRMSYRRRYTENGRTFDDGPAVPTGSALCGFCENVYLREFDFRMSEKAAFYARCADDILIGAKTREDLLSLIEEIRRTMDEKKLSLSEKKSLIIEPGGEFDFLGWKICSGGIDFTDETLSRLEKLIHRETIRALRQYSRHDVDPLFRISRAIQRAGIVRERAGLDHSFRIVSRTDGLNRIDHMLIDMIRIIVTGKKGNARYRLSYDDIRRWGYRSLVGDYHRRFRSGRPKNEPDRSSHLSDP